MIIHNRLWSRAAHLDLRAHFLHRRSKRLNLLLLLCESRLEIFALLFDFAVLFEELVEQHRVHRFVADSVDLAAFIADHQVRINLGDFLGDQTKFGPVRLVSFCSGRSRA